MTQQGDNWWDALYDEAAEDIAPTASGDSLDARFASATRATTPDTTAPDTAPPPPTTAPLPPVPPAPPAAPPEPPRPARSVLPPPPRPASAPEAVPPAKEAEPGPGAVPSPPPARPTVPPAVLGPAPWEAPVSGPRTFPSPPAAPPEPEPKPAGEDVTVQVQVPDGHEPTVQVALPAAMPRPRSGFVGSRPPTYEAEPTALPTARPGELGDLVPDTVLDGARYGTATLRAASVRGDSARYRGEPRRDALLTARFGHDETALVLVAVAAGSRAADEAHLAAADVCRWIGEAVGRSHARLSEDIRSGRRGDLKSGLHRLTDRTYGRLRASAAERGLAPDAYTATLRCLLIPADPDCRTRVFFGIGGGGLFRLRDGAWQDIEPLLPDPASVTGAPVVGFGSTPPHGTPEVTEEGDRLTMDLGIATAPGPVIEEPVPAPAEPFRFRASVARPGDTLLLASPGLAEPMRGEPALARELAARWTGAEPPGLAAFLADTQLRVTGYADDRTGAAVWEA
ncbi:protein phosphatase 2C domain-containing protein [Streptomyces sp. CC208A]|uniref:protein phosphatase 2C domain-containing protein n=1 Tax=Streptomyces sp. CC208A TaxID=3044573 RepID=UPI0024A8111B|nr:protein phosphatase 2C domain-containing protein [Streptomyces sp. CC208A]